MKIGILLPFLLLAGASSPAQDLPAAAVTSTPPATAAIVAPPAARPTDPAPVTTVTPPAATSVAAIAEAPAETADAPTVPTNALPSLVERSLALRDPFWPIGWFPKDRGATAQAQKPGSPVAANPEQAAPAEVVIDWAAAAKLIKIKGVTRLNNRFLAIIDGLKDPVEIGRKLSIQYKGVRYSWRIREITDKGITPERLDAVPIGQK